MTDFDFVSATRAAYDTVAVSYAEVLKDALAESPWDRAMLDTFAELVGPGARVGDFGCGPGRVTGYLAGRGLAAFGVDLSPGMVEVARAAHPELAFEVGSMAALPVGDAEVAGALAWYSLIHTPPERLPVLVAELARVLVPGGRLLTAFQTSSEVGVGAEPRHVSTAYGHDVSLDAYRLDPDFVTGLLGAAGFAVEARLVREAAAHEKTPQAYLLARKES
ncbi:class I SAM-dependent methyltransferase [Amycolatopsis sp. NPDC004368]